MNDINIPENNMSGKIIRGMLQTAGSVPIAGGLFSAIAGAWSENEQEKANKFFEQWLKMLQDEISEKEKTIVEIMTRLDLLDEEVASRVQSSEYQALVRKTFREWSGAESEEKRIYIRNILANAGATSVSSDDVIRLFIDWINTYSELHFKVIATVYNSNGIGRGEIWRELGKNIVREDSAEADLYKLLIGDLSMGRIIRQHREVDYAGHYLKKPTIKKNRTSGSNKTKSAFDDDDKYELTALGEQFVHYAMTDIPVKISNESK